MQVDEAAAVMAHAESVEKWSLGVTKLLEAFAESLNNLEREQLVLKQALASLERVVQSRTEHLA